MRTLGKRRGLRVERCGRCRYDCKGLPRGARRCPECGWNLFVEFPAGKIRAHRLLMVMLSGLLLYFVLVGRAGLDELGFCVDVRLLGLQFGLLVGVGGLAAARQRVLGRRWAACLRAAGLWCVVMVAVTCSGLPVVVMRLGKM